MNPYLDDFTGELADSGYTRLSMYAYVFAIVHFDEWLQRQGVGIADIDEVAIRRFATHRCRCSHGRRRGRQSRRYVKRVRRFVEYLASRGVMTRPRIERTKQTISYLAEYRDWLLSTSRVDRTIDPSLRGERASVCDAHGLRRKPVRRRRNPTACHGRGPSHLHSLGAVILKQRAIFSALLGLRRSLSPRT